MYNILSIFVIPQEGYSCLEVRGGENDLFGIYILLLLWVFGGGCWSVLRFWLVLCRNLFLSWGILGEKKFSQWISIQGEIVGCTPYILMISMLVTF